MRFNKDIGMFVVNRPKTSCRWATAFCRAHCYNAKLYVAFGHTMNPADVASAKAWECLTGESLREALSRKRKQTYRVRFMSRGEAFKTMSDVHKVADILRANPDTLFWIPTRAWRNETMRKAIETHVKSLPNARVMASLDPTTPKGPAGWSTLYFGDDKATDGRWKCPKTWRHRKGACATCKRGCFSRDTVHVHLKEH